MKIFKTRKTTKNTINKYFIVVFFLIFFGAIMLFNSYGKNTTLKTKELINGKINKVLYQFFSEIITNDIIKKENVQDIINIYKNNNDEILSVHYDLERGYKILTHISLLLKDAINGLENGKINVSLYDQYLKSNKNGLILYIPLFLASNNVFLNNIGPKIPVKINFNETLLTNIKTKVTNYGMNNALLEVYITVEMQKLIITPIEKDEEKFNYDILISALVINGRVPNFYGGVYETNSNILDIPIN